jgi:hypothetical protein
VWDLRQQRGDALRRGIDASEPPSSARVPPAPDAICDGVPDRYKM